jgi:UDP-2,4-diacetamido-2,4,6-trideoxy-beta-L-altropyranose hydrolase
MRCLGLAQAWQDAGGIVVFAMADRTPAVQERLEREGVEVIRLDADPGGAADLACTAQLAQAMNAASVVVDGYHFDSDYQRALKSAGLNLLFVDDNGDGQHYFADLILNQNAHADESFYRNRESYTQLLLGPSYAMLRREFGAWAGWRRDIASVGSKVLVTLGGSDPDNITLQVLRSLQLVDVEGLKFTAVVGGSNPHLASLEAAAAESSPPIHLVRDVRNMPELLAWADLAIAGAGVICWEMCLLGLPAILIDLAPNQLRIAQRLHQVGAGVHIGGAQEVSQRGIADAVQSSLLSAPGRGRMSRVGRELVDGKGASRVVASLLSVSRTSAELGSHR